MAPEIVAVRELLEAHRDEFQALLDRYGATSPKLFGSVARGVAHPCSDIDVFPVQLLKRPISASVLVDSVTL